MLRIDAACPAKKRRVGGGPAVIAKKLVPAAAAPVDPEKKQHLQEITKEAIAGPKPDAALEALRAEVRQFQNGKYELIKKIGHGAHATVFMAREVATGKFVALKWQSIAKASGFQGSDEDFHGCVTMTLLREVFALQTLHQAENVVPFIETFTLNTSTFIVMHYVPSTLEDVIRYKHLTVPCIRSIAVQLLGAVQAAHASYLVHRDIKPSNILMENGKLYLADWGMSRVCTRGGIPLTSMVTTYWYRAPELLLGCHVYDGAIDIWSVGCVLAELFLRAPLYPGSLESTQLATIFSTSGTPTEAEWPKMVGDEFRDVHFAEKPRVPFSAPGVPADAANLINQMLKYNPEHRITAKDALRHPFLRASPL